MSTSFPMRGKRVRFAGDTNVGMKRALNEDSLYLPDQERLAIVADGMGGHSSGEVASKLAVELVSKYFRDTMNEQELTWPYRLDSSPARDINRLVTGIKLANMKIWEAAKETAGKHMGTTIAAASFLDTEVVIAHVGDSRVYRIRDNQIEQLTEDHSLLNDYIRMKKLSSDDAGSFQHKNVIVRALGMKESVQVDIHVDTPRPGDIYLICSDGLSGMVSDVEIAAIAKGESDLDKACEHLIQTANDNGGTDNISVILARIEA